MAQSEAPFRKTLPFVIMMYSDAGLFPGYRHGLEAQPIRPPKSAYVQAKRTLSLQADRKSGASDGGEHMDAVYGEAGGAKQAKTAPPERSGLAQRGHFLECTTDDYCRSRRASR